MFEDSSNENVENINESLKKLPSTELSTNNGSNNEKSIKKHHKGNYKGIHCDSSWELAYVVWCLDHNINIKRYSGFRTYIYNGKKHKYFPDFVIDETVIIEVKGYLDEISKIKLEQNTDIKLLSKIDLILLYSYKLFNIYIKT